MLDWSVARKRDVYNTLRDLRKEGWLGLTDYGLIRHCPCSRLGGGYAEGETWLNFEGGCSMAANLLTDKIKQHQQGAAPPASLS